MQEEIKEIGGYKMTVEQFVKEMKVMLQEKDSELKKYLEDRIITTYIPYTQKIAYCKNILDYTMYKTVLDKKIYYPDTTMQYVFYTLTLINIYTDINIDFKNVVNDYELLDSKNLIHYLINNDNSYGIPTEELDKFQTIFNMMRNDIVEHEESVVNFLNTKYEVLSVLFSTMADAFLDGFNDKLNQTISGMSDEDKKKIIDLFMKKE